MIGLNDSPPPLPPSPASMSKGERNSLGYAPEFLVASPSSYSNCALAAITVAHSQIRTDQPSSSSSDLASLRSAVSKPSVNQP
jgi:hypothetical protein